MRPYEKKNLGSLWVFNLCIHIVLIAHFKALWVGGWTPNSNWVFSFFARSAPYKKHLDLGLDFIGGWGVSANLKKFRFWIFNIFNPSLNSCLKKPNHHQCTPYSVREGLKNGYFGGCSLPLVELPLPTIFEIQLLSPNPNWAGLILTCFVCSVLTMST